MFELDAADASVYNDESNETIKGHIVKALEHTLKRLENEKSKSPKHSVNDVGNCLIEAFKRSSPERMWTK